VEHDRVSELVERLRDDFAHPALVHRTARYLIARARPREAATIVWILPDHIQVSLFRDLLGRHADAARIIVGPGAGREIRRGCALIAAERGLPDLAEEIADMSEHAYDRRVIAERLLQGGARDQALTVIEKADKAYEKRTFAISTITAGDIDLAMQVVPMIGLSREVRRVGERLVDAGASDRLPPLLEQLDRNADKRELALYALRKGRLADVETIATTITVDKDLLEVAKAVYDFRGADGKDADAAGVAVRLLPHIDGNAERREFIDHMLQRDPAAAVRLTGDAIKTSKERRRVAEILSEAGLQQQALDVVALLKRDDQRDRLFWFALSTGQAELAEAAAGAIKKAALAAHRKAVLQTWRES
jgi:hypothetical protein